VQGFITGYRRLGAERAEEMEVRRVRRLVKRPEAEKKEREDTTAQVKDGEAKRDDPNVQ
jgi:hypothetical protein